VTTPRAGESRRTHTTRRILDGAAEAFAKGGYADTSMDQIAAAAGVSRLLLYRDFAGKRELYLAVLERVQEAVRDRVQQVNSPDALRALLEVARADPDGFTLTFRHAAHEPEFAAIVADVTAVHRTVAEDQLRPYVADPVMRRWVAGMTVSITFQAITSWLEIGDPAQDDEFHDRLVTINRSAAKPELHGVRPAGPGGLRVRKTRT
jgi:AcrR family transcriptional regulator